MPAAKRPLPATSGNEPLADAELDTLFAPLANARLIALAVSGGADSLALLDSIDRWRRHKGRPDVIVLTVDHRLRRGSRAEALAVARIARARGVKARILTRSGPPPPADVEAAARSARYRLLLEACREAGATYLLVAHHRDDLAETFLLRLKRGAGVFGLAAMRSWLGLGDVTLVRPFLSVPRVRLAATTEAAGLAAAVDPMNADERYDRVRIRRLLPVLAGEGLDAAMIAVTADRLADAADAIDHAATRLLTEGIEVDARGVAWLDQAYFDSASQAVLLRALGRLFMAIGGDDYAPRSRRLWAIARVISEYTGDGVKRTLAGSVIERWGDRFAVYREAGRQGLRTIKIGSGFAGVWDHRFAVRAEKRVPPGLTLGPLGADGRRAIGVPRGDYPAAVLAALPALRLRGRIIAVPALGWASGPVPVTVISILAERLRQPPLFPDLAAGR